MASESTSQNAPPLQIQKTIAKRTEQRLKRNQLLNTSMPFFDKLVQNFLWNHTASLKLWIFPKLQTLQLYVCGANRNFPIYLQATASISVLLQIFPANCNYCNLCTPIELITNFKSDRLLILIVRTAPGDRKYFNTSSHNSSHLFPPNLSLHLLQCNSNTFNGHASICFEETTIISIQLHQFRSNCARFNPFNHFEPTVIILVWLQLRFSHLALFLNLAVVISSYLHAFQAKLLRRANLQLFWSVCTRFWCQIQYFPAKCTCGWENLNYFNLTAI